MHCFESKCTVLSQNALRGTRGTPVMCHVGSAGALSMVFPSHGYGVWRGVWHGDRHYEPATTGPVQSPTHQTRIFRLPLGLRPGQAEVPDPTDPEIPLVQIPLGTGTHLDPISDDPRS